MRNWRAGLVCVSVITAATAATTSTVLAQAGINTQNGSTTFQTLGFLSTSGPFVESRSLGVSPDGNTVVGFSYNTNGLEAFSWNKATQTMTPLGSLGPPLYGSAATAVSDPIGAGNPGWAVGTTTTSTSGATEAMRVRVDGQGGMAALPGLNPVATQNNAAYGISADGRFIVGTTIKDTSVDQSAATMWRMDPATGAITSTTELPNFALSTSGSAYTSIAQGVTNDGFIAVGVGLNEIGASQHVQAAYWKIDSTGSTSIAQALPYLDPSISQSQLASEARGVQKSGTNFDVNPGGTFLAVGSSKAKNPNNGISTQAVVWKVDSSGATPTGLGFLGKPPSGPYFSQADAVSEQDGVQTIVGASSSADDTSGTITQDAFIYFFQEGLAFDPQHPNLRNKMLSLKKLLNNNMDPNDPTHNYYPDMPSYNMQIPDSFKLLEATAVSADGNTIVGYGYDTISQHNEAFMVTLATPEPGSTLLVGVGTCALLNRRRRARRTRQLA